LFNAYYTDGEAIEIQVNPEFGAGEAAEKAAFYGHAIGQLPLALRVAVEISNEKSNQDYLFRPLVPILIAVVLQRRRSNMPQNRA
jgi:hypothetical protein